MHEYSLIQALVGRVAEEARARDAVAVHRISVTVGELAGVEPELFRSAYELCRAGTICEGAALELVSYPARWTCPGCGTGFARGDVLRCARCDRPARMDERSGALLLERIEMEVP